MKSNTNNIDFVMDIESNRTPGGVSVRPVRSYTGSLGETFSNAKREASVIPFQLAIFNREEDKMLSFTFDNAYTPEEHGIDIKSKYSRAGVFYGEEQEAKMFVGTSQTRKDIEGLFKQKNSKGQTVKQSLVDHYFNKVYKHISKNVEGHEIFFQYMNKQSRHALVSAFSNRYIEKTAKELHRESLEPLSKFMNISGHSTVMELSKWEESGVNNLIDYILKTVNTKGSVNIGAWNAQFEAERISGWVENFASKDLNVKWFNELKKGNIVFKNMESSYINVMFGLAKEDKALLNSMSIPLNPVAFHEFGNRIGNVPKTLHEFSMSVPHTQDLVTSAVSDWLKPISDTKSITSHTAPIDTYRASLLDNFFSSVQDKALELARGKSGNASLSMEEFLRSLDADNLYGKTIMHDAFKSVVAKNAGKDGLVALNGKNTNYILSKFKDTIRDKSVKRSEVISDILKYVTKSGGGPPRGNQPISKFFSSIGKNEKYGYGILAAMAGVAIASTYLTTESDSKISFGGKLGSIGKGKAWEDSYERKDGDAIGGPYLHNNLTSFAYNAIGIYTGVSLIGYRAAKLNGKLFGFSSNVDMKSASSLLKNSAKLFRYGAREIEDHFPITRVFKVSNAIDYLTGAFNTSSGTKKGFNSVFKNVDNIGVGDIDTSTFFDAISKSNPQQATTLNEVMANFKSSKKVKKAKLNIRNLGDTKTSVNIEYETQDGLVKKAFGNELVFDVDTIPIRTSRANSIGRGEHPSKRRLNDAASRIRSTLASDQIVKERSRLGKDTPKTLEEFKQMSSKPIWMNNTIWDTLKKAQFNLELGPKGINQSENIFYNSEIGRKFSKGFVGVRNVAGEASKLDALKYKASHYGAFAEEFVQAGNRFLESPFELMINPNRIKKVVTSLKGSRNPISNVAGRALEFIEHPHLGLNISTMKYGAPEYLVKFGLKRVLPAAGLYYGVKTIDSILGGMMLTKTGRGPITSAPNILYQKASLAYSMVSDILGLTTINKKQESFAPGSTGLGFFALPATLAGGYTLAQGLYNKSPKHLQQFLHKDPRVAKSNLARDIFERFSKSSVYKEVMKKEAYSGALNKSMTARVVESFIKSPKKTLFGAGVALMSPFLLGFLGSSKSYGERKAEFAGQKDVAIRKNRGWLMSGQAIGGESIQQFRQHGSYIYQSNYENRGVLWPSYTSRLLHALTLGMANRYALEEYHKEDQPVYESAPYGASVPIVGPFISKSLGWLLKPIRRYHMETATGFTDTQEYSPRYLQLLKRSSTDNHDQTSPYFNVLDNGLPKGISFNDLASHGDLKQHTSAFFSQITELVGFKGFVSKALYQSISGKDQPDQYSPYLKSATEMYNPSQFMWQYQAGDFSFPGGEFMRRGLQNPRKRWEINNIPNELYGQTWLPKKYQTGTTFDKMPMGWLYASRKGWEFQYPEISGMPMEQYPDNIKLDILKYMAPTSREFVDMSKRVNKLALTNKLTPFEEQRAYDAVEQRSLIKDRLGASSEKSTYSLSTQNINGVVTSLDLSSMTFTLDNGDRKYRLAGISVDENDIRNKLLKEKHYNNSEDLSSDAEQRQREIVELIENQMSVGRKINMKIANTDNGDFSGKGLTEAIVGSLNNSALSKGSPLINTGNLSQYNMSQQQKPVGSDILSSYWHALTDHTNMFGGKLLGSNDYLNRYKKEHIYGRKVKLWNKPIEHFLKPMVSSLMNDIGISIIPASVKHERATEQYWDVIKYIKHKKLENQSGDESEADYYRQLSEETLVGADPINNQQGAKAAISYSKQDYFDYFASEPNAAKRGKIMKYLSNPEKRIYSSIWTANLAKGGNKKLQEKYSLLKETGGYDVDKSVIEDYKSEGQNGSLKDYVRARYVSQFMSSHKLPGLEWEGWDKDVDIENVEIHSLLSEGEQTQDYGYFEQQKRMAAFDKGAYLAAQHINSSRLTSSDFTGTVLPMLTSRTGLDSASAVPTDSPFPIMSNSIQSDSYSTGVYINHNIPSYAHSTISKYFM